MRRGWRLVRRRRTGRRDARPARPPNFLRERIQFSASRSRLASSAAASPPNEAVPVDRPAPLVRIRRTAPSNRADAEAEAVAARLQERERQSLSEIETAANNLTAPPIAIWSSSRKPSREAQPGSADMGARRTVVPIQHRACSSQRATSWRSLV